MIKKILHKLRYDHKRQGSQLQIIKPKDIKRTQPAHKHPIQHVSDLPVLLRDEKRENPRDVLIGFPLDDDRILVLDVESSVDTLHVVYLVLAEENPVQEFRPLTTVSKMSLIRILVGSAIATSDLVTFMDKQRTSLSMRDSR